MKLLAICGEKKIIVLPPKEKKTLKKKSSMHSENSEKIFSFQNFTFPKEGEI
jgi:hypothetical protein